MTKPRESRHWLAREAIIGALVSVEQLHDDSALVLCAIACLHLSHVADIDCALELVRKAQS